MNETHAAKNGVAAESWRDRLTRWRYDYWPDHVLGEILAKRWMETAIPVTVLLIVAFVLSEAIPNFLSAASLADTGRQAGEIGFIVLGMALVMIVGGIDLSVGSMFALTNFCALFLMHVLKWPVAAAIPVTLIFGAMLGAVNGILIGIFRLRAFLTTLITLIIYRALYELLTADYATAIAGGMPDSEMWDFIGYGEWVGIPVVVYVYAAIAIMGHILLTRLRPGWHITAIGGSRRSAYNSGIAVRRTVTMCYVSSGVLTAIGGIFFASRLATVGGDSSHGGGTGGHQSWRGQRLRDEGSSRHAHRLVDNKRLDNDVTRRGIQQDGAWRHFVIGCRNRHPVVEKQTPYRE